MARRALRFLLLGAAAAIFLYLAAIFVFAFWSGGTSPPSAARSASSASISQTRAGANTWGNPKSLPDHFARHGSDFRARTAGEYAALAAQLLQRAKSGGLPAKVDRAGTVRVYDPATGAFGAYNSDGTTETFFKPGSASYFCATTGARCRPENREIE